QFDYEALPRPSFLYFRRCRDLVLRDVTLKNSPAWTVHLLRCQNARVETVTIRNPLHGPNTDGIDVNSSIDVVIRRCDIITGDDGVVLKSTEPGHDHPSRNITVEDCRIWSACNCLKIGTETHDRFENIVFRNCRLYGGSDAALERPLSGLAIESVDGASLSGITATDLTMDNVRAPIFVRLGHRGGNSDRTRQVEPRVPGRIERVVIRNVTAERSMFESSITGIAGHCVQDITLENIRLQYEGGGKEDWVLAEVPDEQVIARYPEAQMFGRLPAWGLYCRHAEGIRLVNVAFSCLVPDPRPVLVCDDVADLAAERLGLPATASGLPLVWLVGTHDAVFRECTAPAGTRVFVAAEGSPDTIDSVRLESCDTGQAKTSLARLGPGELVDLNLPALGKASAGTVAIDAPAMRLLDPMAAESGGDDLKEAFIVAPLSASRDHGTALCRFEVAEAGPYEIWAEAFAPSGESNSFFVSVDRSSPALSDVDRLNQWTWVEVQDREEESGSARKQVVFNLQPGVHTLEVRNRESGTKIRRLVVAQSGSGFDPRAAGH
ncbi:MAG: glycoside hydrolase family 28 protein, partial [Thermoguttaceae bacterium]